MAVAESTIRGLGTAQSAAAAAADAECHAAEAAPAPGGGTIVIWRWWGPGGAGQVAIIWRLPSTIDTGTYCCWPPPGYNVISIF